MNSIIRRKSEIVTERNEMSDLPTEVDNGKNKKFQIGHDRDQRANKLFLIFLLSLRVISPRPRHLTMRVCVSLYGNVVTEIHS